MNDRLDRQISLWCLLVIAGMVALLFVLAHSGRLEFGKRHSIGVALAQMPPTFMLAAGTPRFGNPDSIGGAIDALPPTAAGQTSSLEPALAEAQRSEAYLGGKVTTGRVAEVYVRVADNMFLALDRAPEHLRNSAERWVDVQFPELLANDIGSARAMLNRSDARVAVGDVVEIKFAHKDNPRYFPVKELTRVTALVASKHQMLARDFERRILARTSPGNARPQWSSRTQAPQPASSRPVQTATADAGR